MTWLLSRNLWRAIAVAAILAGLAWAYTVWVGKQRDIGRNEIRAQWQADKLNIEEQNRILLMANAKATDHLQAVADKQRENDRAEKLALGRRVAGLLDSLRDRPERPAADKSGSDLPSVAGAGTDGPGNGACTGDRLYRDDSEALVRLGAAGDILRTALRSCLTQRASDIKAVNGR